MDSTTHVRITREQLKQLDIVKRSLSLKKHSEVFEHILHENARLEVENKLFRDQEKARNLQSLVKK